MALISTDDYQRIRDLDLRKEQYLALQQKGMSMQQQGYAAPVDKDPPPSKPAKHALLLLLTPEKSNEV